MTWDLAVDAVLMRSACRRENLKEEIHTKNAALVHAYLHRREGDLSNANYWYLTAGESAFNGTMEEEWEKLSIALLND